MVEIIIKGGLNKRKVTKYIHTCKNCDTIYTYEYFDTTLTYDGQEFIKCPVCGAKNYLPLFFKKKYKGASNG